MACFLNHNRVRGDRFGGGSPLASREKTSLPGKNADPVGKFRLQARVSVPALMRCMESRNPQLRSTAATALGLFGKDAKAAVPLLLRATNERAGVTPAEILQTSPVAEAAKQALRLIAPEVLEKVSHEEEEK